MLKKGKYFINSCINVEKVNRNILLFIIPLLYNSSLILNFISVVLSFSSLPRFALAVLRLRDLDRLLIAPYLDVDRVC